MAALADESRKYVFDRTEIYSSSFANTGDSYDRYVFFCYESYDAWPSRVEDFDANPIPKLLNDAFEARKDDMPLKTCLIVCSGCPRAGCSDGDVLIFPEMIKYRALKESVVDSFVDDVLVNGKPWVSGAPETFTGAYIFVCAHASRDKRCSECGPILIEKLKEEITARGLDENIFVNACSHVGGHKYAGNIIILGTNGDGKVIGDWYGYVTPNDVPNLIDVHIGKGEITEKLWSLPSSLSLSHQRIKLNIGGTVFETTTSTLRCAMNSSYPTFIDRDPELFSALLSLLRTHRLPSSSLGRFSHCQLLHESRFYNLHLTSTSPPPLSPFDASFAYSLSPPSDPFISTLSFSDPHSSLLLAHNGVVSSYHSSLSSTLSLSSATRTHLDTISSIRHVSGSVAVVGSEFSPGLHFYSTTAGEHVGSTHWMDPTDHRTHKAHVTAIANDSGLGNSIFASFECLHGENAILSIDKETTKVASVIGRQSGSAAKSSAMRKLTWVPSVGLLIGSSVKCGALGYSGYIRAWDPRAGKEVWETSEPGGSGRISRSGDTMADVDVDPDGLFLAKVGCRTGDLGVADLRSLGPDPWVYLEDPNPRRSGVGLSGQSVVVRCHRKHVFVGKEGGLEAWSSLNKREEVQEGEETEWGSYRRNYVDKEHDEIRGAITKIESGGNRLFVCRENTEGVEVWESSDFSGAKVVL